MNQMFFFPIKKNIKTPQKQRLYKLVNRSYLSVLFICLVVGILGYLSLLDNLPDFFLYRKHYNKDSKDIFMLIGKFGFAFFVWVAITLNIYPVQDDYSAFSWKKQH